MTPKQIKDDFEKLLEDTPVYVPKIDKSALKNDLPYTVAEKFEETSKVSHHYNSVDQWSIFSGDQYQQVKDDNEIRLYVRKFISKCSVKKEKKKGEYVEPLKKQSKGYVSDVIECLASMSSVHILPSQKAPYSFDSSLDVNSIIAMKNGLLDLSNTKKPVLRLPTKKFYTFNYLPVIYDPNALAPTWLKILSFSFTNEDGSPDEIARDVLHSWLKRWLLRITVPHKICALIGEKRSGKSTIGRIACALVGQANVSSVTIASLSGPHGTHGLMNKQLGVMWDAKVVGRIGDTAKAVEVLKNISGQDNMAVNPKGRDIIELTAMKLNILMIANKPADLRDDTGALASRFSFLKTTQSFLGHEDPSMEKQIIEHELPGILNLILKAPDTIIEHPKSDILAQEFAEMSSPYIAFANDYCEIGDKEDFVPVDILWAYYIEWCKNYNHRAPSAQKFKIEFPAAVSGLERYRPRLDDLQIQEIKTDHGLKRRLTTRLTISERPQCYRKIRLTDEVTGVWSGQGKDTLVNDGSGSGQGSLPF